jgi:multiple sugar transport system substrate-binding protein
MTVRRRLVATLTASAALSVAACGGDDGGGRDAAPKATGTTRGAEKAPSRSGAGDAKGRVTYCTAADRSGAHRASVRRFNRRFAGRRLRARLLELGRSADEQRDRFIRLQRARSGDCDVLYSDVTWIAELASRRWLLETTDYVQRRKGEFIPSTLRTARYDAKYWGVPKDTDAGFLYYRTDQLDSVPPTWQAVYDEAKQGDGIVYAGTASEELTVAFLELAFAAGGRVLSDDGARSEIESDANVSALRFMVDGIEDGAAPKAVTTYTDAGARRAFESGRATFMRNWPDAYLRGQRAGRIKGRFDIAPYPEFDGGGTAAVLGGHDLVISAFSKNPEGAVLLVDHLTSPQEDKRSAAGYAMGPVLRETYRDREVRRALPFSAELEQAVAQAQPRPVSPVYRRISSAIYENVYLALTGRQSPEEALKKADEEIDAALRSG